MFLLGHFTKICFCFLQGSLLPGTPCHNIIVSYILNIKYLLSRSIKISIGIRIIITLLLIINGIIRLVKIGVKLFQIWHPEKYECFFSLRSSGVNKPSFYYCCLVTVVLLSHALTPPPAPRVNVPPITHAHESSIHVPRLAPSLFFPLLPPSLLPSGHCQFVLYFHVSGSILLICLFCWLGST